MSQWGLTVWLWMQAIVQANWWNKPEWWSAIGTISAVVVALFGETVWAWLRRPKLDLAISVRRPDCVKTTLTDLNGQVIADCYYFRVLVSNSGKRRAEDVELYAQNWSNEKTENSQL